MVERTKAALETERQHIAEQRMAALESRMGSLQINMPPSPFPVQVYLDGNHPLES